MMQDEHIQLINHEIDLLNANIQRHQGVGIYQDMCQRWMIQIEAYERLLKIVTDFQNN